MHTRGVSGWARSLLVYAAGAFVGDTLRPRQRLRSTMRVLYTAVGWLIAGCLGTLTKEWG